MRKITNKQFLPEALVRAVTHDRYDGGTGDISVTTLIAPPQMRALTLTYSGEIVEDAADRIWSMMGSAVHYVVENAVETMKEEGDWDSKNCISEKRYYRDFKDITISGQIDLYEKTVLNDFKLTSVWAIKDAINGGKDDWEAQLNLQRWLMAEEFIEVKELYIVAIARDWNKSGSLRDRDYPPRACRIEIPIWSDKKMDEYLQERYNAHFGKYVPLCTPKECWESISTYALRKEGRQSALRVMESEADLIDWAALKGHTKSVTDEDGAHQELKKDFYIEFRQGARKRCDDYCDVAPFCEQYKEWRTDK
jgi:tellurite resistance-related uncharacterized protein